MQQQQQAGAGLGVVQQQQQAGAGLGEVQQQQQAGAGLDEVQQQQQQAGAGLDEVQQQAGAGLGEMQQQQQQAGAGLDEVQQQQAGAGLGVVCQAAAGRTKQGAAAGMSRKMQSMTQEQRSSLESLETRLQEELQQMRQYRKKLAGSNIRHASLMEELEGQLKRHHHPCMQLLQEEKGRVEEFMMEGEEELKVLRAARVLLDGASQAAQAVTAIEAADHSIMTVEEWLQHSREDMPNSTTLSHSFQVLEATIEALNVFKEEDKCVTAEASPGHPRCTLQEAAQDLETVPVQFDDLKSEKLQQRLDDGRVYVIQRLDDGSCYSSKVVREGEELLLQAMKEERPPPGAFTLQASQVLKILYKRDKSVFLDLAWEGVAPKRIRVQIRANTSFTRQFVSLCLGHSGLTYRDTNLVEVKHNARQGRVVWGGCIRGQAAAAAAAAHHTLLPVKCEDDEEITDEETKVKWDRNVQNGVVVARTRVSGTEEETDFGMVLERYGSHNCPPWFCQLGTLQGDWEVVLEAALKNDITQVRVVNCGLMC